MKYMFVCLAQNTMDTIEICDEKGNIKYTASFNDKGEGVIYHNENIMGSVKRSVQSSIENYEFYRQDTYLGKMTKETIHRKPNYLLSIEGWEKHIQIYSTQGEYHILDPNHEWIMKFKESASFNLKQYELTIVDKENEELCLYTALSILMSISNMN